MRSARHYKNNIYVANYQKKNYTIAVGKRGYISQIAYKDDMDNIVNIHFGNIRTFRRRPSSRALTCPYPRSFDLLGEEFLIESFRLTEYYKYQS